MRLAIVVFMTLSIPVSRPLAQERREITMTAGFDAYARGEFDLIARAIERIGQYDRFVRELRRDAIPWIEAAAPDAVTRRRFVVAAVALETAVAVLHSIDRQPTQFQEKAQSAMELVTWACSLVRRNPVPTEGEHAWHRAALAVLQRTAIAVRRPTSDGDRSVADHTRHAEERFPDDPRWTLARAGGPTKSAAPPRVPGEQARLETLAKPAMVRVGREFEKLLPNKQMRAEALLGIAFSDLRRGSIESAWSRLQQVETSTTEPNLLYVARFFRGQILASRGDHASAVDAFAAALSLVPGALSGVTALAAIRFEHGERAAAVALIEDAFAKQTVDPLRTFMQGEFDLWPELRDAVRKAIQ
jgi:tetratricopeptide (TPR) repeat protein